MHVLVTGGAGFIGGHLAEHFLADGADVTVVDNFDPFYDVGIKEHTVEYHRSIADEIGVDYTFVEGDIRDGDLMVDLVTAADAVYHQAALAGVRPSVDRPLEYNAVNVDGTLTILEAARNTDLQRLVFASSSSVYGGRVEYLPFSETDPTMPVSPYGASKLAGERYVAAYAAVYDVPAVVTRYFTVYGPRMRPNMAISNFVSRCMRGVSPEVYGDGSKRRDFTYIDDVVAVNEALLEDDSVNGETFNIGSGGIITIGELATLVRDEIDPSLDIDYTDPRAGDAEATRADVTKLYEHLDYEPQVPIEDGVKRFIDWYGENRAWYEPLVVASA